MVTNKVNIVEKVKNIEKRLIMDYSNLLILVSDNDIYRELTSILNEKIDILSKLRVYSITKNENCMYIPASDEEIRAVIDKFNY